MSRLVTRVTNPRPTERVLTSDNAYEKFGRNGDIDIAGNEDIWSPGGVYAFPASALATTIVSDDVADDSAGTGVRTVTIEGLDANWDQVTQTAPMDGTTPVTLATPLLRCYRAFVVTVGSGDTNTGNIQIKHGSTVLAQIDAGVGSTLMAIFSIPAGKTGYLTRWFADVETNATSDCVMELKSRIDGEGWRVRRTGKATDLVQLIRPLDFALVMPAKTDIVLHCATCSANNTSVDGGFDLFIN